MEGTLPKSWGATADERARSFACDRFAERYGGPMGEMYRAVSVDAPPATVYRWLCQLRVAPYSYDWIDNLGRTSPRTLTPGLDDLQIGMRAMSIFTIVDFTRDEQITFEMTHPWAVRAFGEGLVTYAVQPGDLAKTSRLIAKLVFRDYPSLLARVRLRLLEWGDLVMMRKQLLTIKKLAEGS